MHSILFSLAALFSFSSYLHAQVQHDELITIVESELKRELNEFSKAPLPPYYIAFRINDIQSLSIASSFGSLVDNTRDRARVMVTTVKVGDYAFDNSHTLDELDNIDLPDDAHQRGVTSLPLEDQAAPIKYMIWQQTQRAYRSALGIYKAIKNLQQSKPSPVADFSKEASPVTHVDAPLPDLNTFINVEEWLQRIKKFSAPFLTNVDVVDAKATLDVGLERKYFVSSEGSRIAQNRTYVYVTIYASVRAEDGDIIPLQQSYFAFDPSKLPTDEIILADVAAMLSKLNTLRTAPVAEPYTGPAILYAHAAGVFFHEIFGHRVEGHRLKDKQDGQTFKGKVTEQVLPKTFSVTVDPTLTDFNGQALNGFYQYDDEGIKGQRVNIVEKGVLKNFLMSRTPLENFANSNGHGRAQAGLDPVSRQSNLIIENEKTVPMAELRKMLVSECKKQKKLYGYLFMDVMGGFTTTQRYMPNAFNIFPTEVYRVYVDGRADELVRGVDLIGTPLAMFAEIQAADNKREVFTGFCGAESGSVPVTAISPSLFVKRIETQKKASAQVEKALLQKPSGN